ncbi:MAG: FAD-dependent oxidoreductase [Desulfobacterales bacterium]|nr:FAD-dependent oxidoreductase [Desulfobacterales bacterium]
MKKAASHDSVNISRRILLKGIAAAPFILSSASTWASIPAEPDVVIIGAGAAGLGAAKTLTDLGISFIMIEAQARTGGRAYTDEHIFGIPYDMGCHWLNYDDANPWYNYGKNNDFTIIPEKNDPYGLFVGNRPATKIEMKAYDKEWDRFSDRICRAAEGRNPDVSPAEAMEIDNKWKFLVSYIRGPLGMGKEIDEWSCKDWYWSGSESFTTFCNEGYGSIVAHYRRNLPVELATPAQHIDWQGSGVKTGTPKGTINSKAVIITVSTGVLGADKIKFTPSLPVVKQESFQYVSMGTYNNVALQFSKDFFGLGPDAYVDYVNEAGTEGGGMLTNMGGTNLSYVYSGGDLGRELELAGFEAGVEWGLNEVVKAYGSDAGKYFIKGNFTRWGEHPWTLGSYASAKPGYWHMREELRKTVADKIFFAGEATHPKQWATCGGGILSGIDAANNVAKTFGKR